MNFLREAQKITRWQRFGTNRGKRLGRVEPKAPPSDGHMMKR